MMYTKAIKKYFFPLNTSLNLTTVGYTQLYFNPFYLYFFYYTVVKVMCNLGPLAAMDSWYQ